MGEMKPTPGPWWTDEYGGLRHGSARENDTVPVEGVALISGSLDSPRVRQARANRDLLLEAGTVFHNTGLSPVQLVEMVKELKEALRDMNAGWDYIRRTHGDLYGVGWDRCEEKASAALAKCEGVGNDRA